MYLTELGKKKGKNGKRRPAHFERRLLLSVLFAGLPGILLSLPLLWVNSYSLDHKIEGTVLLVGLWLGLSFATRNQVVHSLQALSNVVSALKQDDFSFRAIEEIRGDALGDLALEINDLARALEAERTVIIETAGLLRQVMDAAQASIFTFSADGKVRLVNRAGTRLLGRSEGEILNWTAEELGIENLQEGPRSETISRGFQNVEKRWMVSRTYFRQHGVRHRLVILSEISEALRAEERSAWQRIIRVLGHEINNSLAPIKSIARTLGRMSSAAKLPLEISENLKQGLEVITTRADSLNRFLQSYTRLAKLPAPAHTSVSVKKLITQIASLTVRYPVAVLPGPDIQIYADPAQLEQALINLVRNGVEAMMSHDTAPADDVVTISWEATATHVMIRVVDRGSGVPETENLFVPFFTTKETGSGIGLLLSRQIIEAHGGTLVLRNRQDHQRGAAVEICLPIALPSETDGDDALPSLQERNPMDSKH